jgi:outer membrane receptor protein involved in Fe transport
VNIGTTCAGLLAVTLLAGGADAQQQRRPESPSDPVTFEDTIQVTATRFGEPVAEVPGSITVVSGDEIRARGATAAVPGLIGVREVDDLLLLVDGIPAGGAFIPQFEAISLTTSNASR